MTHDDMTFDAIQLIRACKTKEEYLVWCDLHKVDPIEHYSKAKKFEDEFARWFGFQTIPLTYEEFYAH